MQDMIFKDIKSLFSFLENTKPRKSFFWFGISGSWKKTNKNIEREVRDATREIMKRGGGIVSGGALNVDFFATDEALIINPSADRIRVFLPTTLKLYIKHYRKRAKEGVITTQQAETLIVQLEKIHNINPDAIIVNPDNKEVSIQTYFDRNSEVVEASDAIIAFQVNKSEGVEDTYRKALAKSKPVFLKEYMID